MSDPRDAVIPTTLRDIAQTLHHLAALSDALSAEYAKAKAVIELARVDAAFRVSREPPEDLVFLGEALDGDRRRTLAKVLRVNDDLILSEKQLVSLMAEHGHHVSPRLLHKDLCALEDAGLAGTCRSRRWTWAGPL